MCAIASVTCELTHCEIKIDPSSCDYVVNQNLIFESYDENNNSDTNGATLHTDVVTINYADADYIPKQTEYLHHENLRPITIPDVEFKATPTYHTPNIGQKLVSGSAYASLTQGPPKTLEFALSTSTGKYNMLIEYIDTAYTGQPVVRELPVDVYIYSYGRSPPI